MYLGKKNENRIPEKDYEPREEGPGARFAYVFFEHFWELLLANLLCVLFSLPVFTLPSAFAAFHAVIQQYYRKGYGDVWPTFLGEFKAEFPERFFAGALPFLFSAVIGVILLQFPSSLVTWLIMAAALVLSFSVYGWLFPQLPFLKISPLEALKNALLLTALHPGRSILLTGIIAVFLTLFVFFLPVSLLALLFLLPLAPVFLTELAALPVISTQLVREETGSSAEDGSRQIAKE